MKPRRHEHIRRILDEAPVASHEQLRCKLADHGIEVTQATLSRDLRELGVLKSPEGYRLPAGPGIGHTAHRVAAHSGPVAAARPSVRTADLVAQHVTGVRRAAGMVVLLTTPGSAGVVALDLDRTPPDGVVGTIAGDDTVFIAVEPTSSPDDVASTLSARVGLPLTRVEAAS